MKYPSKKYIESIASSNKNNFIFTVAEVREDNQALDEYCAKHLEFRGNENSKIHRSIFFGRVFENMFRV